MPQFNRLAVISKLAAKLIKIYTIMTNASVKNSVFVLCSFAIAAVLSLGAFATIANAQEYDSGWGSGGEVSYDSGWGTGSYDPYVYDSGWGTGGVGDYAYTYEPTGCGSDCAYTYEPIGCGSDCAYTYEPTGCGSDCAYTYEPSCGCYEEYIIEEGVMYTDRSYSTGGGYSYPSYTPSYSAARPFSFSAPSTYDAPSRPAPQPQRPVQQQQQQQQQQSSTPINIVNTNNNNNVNNNTNTVSVVVPVAQTQTTYPIQYVYPQQPTQYCPAGSTGIYPNCVYPTYPTQNAYCTISASPSSIANGQAAYLTWSSTGATSAWLSDGIGTVAPTGSLAVRPNTSKTYTLTISGYGGTRTCSTYVTVQGSYISLSQIPYTGFDAGILGNAMYWLSLISFAIAGAYLAVYYKGGAFALAGAMIGSRKVSMNEIPTPSPIETDVPTETAVETMTPSPIDALENLPVAPMAKATMDSMQVLHSKEGSAPRIVITRS